MIWYEVKDSLNDLIKDAKNISTYHALTVWMAEIGDMLQLALPANSNIIKEYSERKKVLDDLHGDMSPEQINEEIQKCIPLLKGAIRVGQLSYHDKDEPDDLWTEFERVFVKRYIKSIWFYIPSGILIGAIIFAMFGVIQIQSYRADIRDVAEKAIERAMKRIDKTTGDAAEDIVNHKNRAITSLDNITATENFAIDISKEKERIKKAYIDMDENLDKQKLANDKLIEQLEKDRGVLQEDLTTNIPKQVAAFSDDIKTRVTESYNAVVKEETNKEKEQIRDEIQALQADARRANNSLIQSLEIARFFKQEFESKVNEIDNSIISQVMLRISAEYWLWGTVAFLLFVSLGFSISAHIKAARK